MSGGALIGIGATTIMALIYDTDGTIKLVTILVTIRGFTWIIKKVVKEIDYDSSQIIDFTGWCIAGYSAAGILKNALGSVKILTDAAGKVVDFANKIDGFFDKAGSLLDKVIFWS